MNENERIQEIEDIIYEIELLQGRMDTVMDGAANESHYKSYGRYGFDQLLGNGNPYDPSLQNAIDTLVKDDNENLN